MNYLNETVDYTKYDRTKYWYTKEKESYICSLYDVFGTYRQKQIDLDTPP